MCLYLKSATRAVEREKFGRALMRNPLDEYLESIPVNLRKRNKIMVSIDPNVLRKYPFLDKLQKQYFPLDTLNEIMNALEKRPEGFKVTLLNNMLRISLRTINREGNEDDLGLPRIEGRLKEICEVVRDDTRSDPRKEVVFSRKSSILAGSNLSDDALIVPNHLPTKKVRVRHPLDRVSTEEVAKRRELADKRWSDGFKKRPRKRNPAEEVVRNAQKFFDKTET
jgi:hypothetical protein